LAETATITSGVKVGFGKQKSTLTHDKCGAGFEGRNLSRAAIEVCQAMWCYDAQVLGARLQHAILLMSSVEEHDRSGELKTIQRRRFKR
jgi:hypothetical protein